MRLRWIAIINPLIPRQKWYRANRISIIIARPRSTFIRRASCSKRERSVSLMKHETNYLFIKYPCSWNTGTVSRVSHSRSKNTFERKRFGEDGQKSESAQIDTPKNIYYFTARKYLSQLSNHLRAYLRHASTTSPRLHVVDPDYGNSIVIYRGTMCYLVRHLAHLLPPEFINQTMPEYARASIAPVKQHHRDF